MCIVPVNESVQTMQDVYFLVGSIINRQTLPFSKEDIFKYTEENIKGSSVTLSKADIKKIIDHELDILYRNCIIKVSGHKFVNQSSVSFTF